MIFIRSRLVVASSLLAASLAGGQAPDTASLSTMIISATKTPASRSSLTQSVTVISGEELRSRGLTMVSDALRLVPGVTMVQNGSTGSVNTLFLRGGESRYTKVLIDGVAVNAPGGFFDFSHLTTDNIERIEIVRGPASVVYGADAVSGIVRIFTRQGHGPPRMSAEGRAGSNDARELTLDASAAGRRARFSIGGGAHRTDGVLAFNNQYYNGTLGGSIGIKPGESSDAVLTARYTDAEFHYPTDYTGLPVDTNSYRVQHRLTLGLDASTRLARSLKGRLLLGTNEVSDLTEDIAVPFGDVSRVHSADRSRSKRRTAEAGFVLGLPQATTLNVGAEYLRESEVSTSSSGPVGGSDTPTSRFDGTRHNTAIYSELISTTRAGGSATLAARRDDNSDYDAFTTYRAGLSMPAGLSSRVRASISTAFNAPAFNQIRSTLYTVASPGLKPERARSWEVGMEQTLADGMLRISATYFHQQFSDVIQFVSGGPPAFLGSYANLTEAQSNGYELELTLSPEGELSAAGSYTSAKPHVTRIGAGYSGDLSEGDPLIRRPTRAASGSLTWARPGTGSMSAMASYAGERPDLDFTQFPSPMVTLPAYIKVDVAASRDVLRSASGKASLALTFRVDNALDRKYEEVLHFPAPRRSFLVGARLSGAL